MPVHTYNAAMTCGGCSGAITRILTKQLQEGEKFDVSKITVLLPVFKYATGSEIPPQQYTEPFDLGQSRSKDCQS